MAEKRWITCDACGVDRFRPLSVVAGWTIGKCQECGLVYVNPAPFFSPTEEFSRVSSELGYTQFQHQPVTETILAFEKRQLLANAKELSRIAGARSDSSGRVRFLDIGCGNGAAVRAASDLGWEAIGIDLDPELVDEGKAALNVDLRCTPILESGLPHGQFDFIKIRDVIEHLPNPFEALQEVRELLSPRGVLLITTVNQGGLIGRARTYLRLKPKLVATVLPPHHLHAFDQRTIRRMAERAGLKPYAIFSTTPIDGQYWVYTKFVSGRRSILRPVWRVGTAVGMGPILVAWVGKA